MYNNEANNFEFLLTLGNNIVCQRYFPVKNYNPKAKNSIELYEYMKYMCNYISEDLKNKNADYMIENKNLFENVEYVEDNKTPQYYLLDLKLNGKSFNQRIFQSNLYHPKVRLDVRDYVKNFISDLTWILSDKKCNTKYLNQTLHLEETKNLSNSINKIKNK